MRPSSASTLISANGYGRGYASAPYPGTSQRISTSVALPIWPPSMPNPYITPVSIRVKATRTAISANKNWQVDEKVTTWYGQLNLDAEFGTVRMTGNVGVQYAA